MAIEVTDVVQEWTQGPKIIQLEGEN